MTTAPQPGSGENEPNNEALEDGLRNLVNEALTPPSNAQIPTNKQPLNSDIMIKAVREVAIKYKTTPPPLAFFCTAFGLGKGRGLGFASA